MAAAQEFYATFRETKADLDARIGSTLAAEANTSKEDTFKQILAEIQALRKSVIEAAAYLPAHDRRSYESQLAELEKRVYEGKSEAAPKSKFSFRKKSGASGAVSSPQQSAIPAALTKPNQDPSQSDTNTAPSVISHKYLTFRATLSPLTAEATTTATATDLSISNLDSCVVNLQSNGNSHQRGPVSTAVHVRNVKNSLLLLGDVEGSALVHDLNRCTVVITCRQLRVHTSHNCLFLIRTVSDAIIEDSTGLVFGPYPSELTSQALASDDNDNDTSTRQKISVQDFSHLKSSASPNWSLLPSHYEPTGDDLNVTTATPFNWELKDWRKTLRDLLATPIHTPSSYSHIISDSKSRSDPSSNSSPSPNAIIDVDIDKSRMEDILSSTLPYLSSAPRLVPDSD